MKRNTEFWKDQKFRIEKDINRTDRNLDLFKNPKKRKENTDGSTTETTAAINTTDNLTNSDTTQTRNQHQKLQMRKILMMNLMFPILEIHIYTP